MERHDTNRDDSERDDSNRDEMNREAPEGLRDELEGPDQAGHSTMTTGAGGESSRSDDAGLAWSEDDSDPIDTDEAVVGQPSSGGSGPGFVAPPPGTEWPDPLGRDDDERELERRTR